MGQGLPMTSNSLIAIVGGMCTGKDVLARIFLEFESQFKICHFATGIKQIARKYFSMVGKNRQLLQKIGRAMREIDPNVWIRLVLAMANKHQKVIVADVRLENQAKALIEKGYNLIWLQVSKQIQMHRICKKYGKMAKSHLVALGDETERLEGLKKYCKFKCEVTTIQAARNWVKEYLNV